MGTYASLDSGDPGDPGPPKPPGDFSLDDQSDDSAPSSSSVAAKPTPEVKEPEAPLFTDPVLDLICVNKSLYSLCATTGKVLGRTSGSGWNDTRSAARLDDEYLLVGFARRGGVRTTPIRILRRSAVVDVADDPTNPATTFPVTPTLKMEEVCMFSSGHTGDVCDLLPLPNSRLVSTSGDSTIRIFQMSDAQSWKENRSPKKLVKSTMFEGAFEEIDDEDYVCPATLLGVLEYGHRTHVWQAKAFPSTPNHLFTSSHSNYVKMWDLNQMKCLGSGRHADAIQGLCVIDTSDHQLVAAASNGKEFGLWDPREVAERWQPVVNVPTGDCSYCCLFWRAVDLFVVGGRNQVSFWDIRQTNAPVLKEKDEQLVTEGDLDTPLTPHALCVGLRQSLMLLGDQKDGKTRWSSVFSVWRALPDSPSRIQRFGELSESRQCRRLVYSNRLREDVVLADEGILTEDSEERFEFVLKSSIVKTPLRVAILGGRRLFLSRAWLIEC